MSVKIDGNVTKFWATKKQAEEAASKMGYSKKNTIEVHTRFQIGWAIMKAPLAGLVTREEWAKYAQ